MGRRTRGRPLMIGIGGDSGSGKTTLAAGLVRALGSEQAIAICVDDYHRYARKDRKIIGITPHDPACNYMDIFAQHVALLREGEPILKPIYNHNGGILEAPEYVTPRDYIIFEGLLSFATPALRDVYDLKFWLEPDEDLRQRWKLQRDLLQGGYTVEELQASLEPLRRDSERYVLPQRAYADMIVGFYPPESRPDETNEALNVRHVLRPTLPHFDLSAILDVGADKGVELELARDRDGRPVDALIIDGTVDAPRAQAMQAYLWSQLPGTGQPLPPLGQFVDDRGDVRHSYPLAVSQLLIGHILHKAEVDQHVS